MLDFPSPARRATATQQRTEATRIRILETAAARMADVGYHGTSYSELVSASGLSKGAFYHHFRSKEELALAVYRYKQALVLEATEKALQGIESPWQRLLVSLRLRGKLFGSDHTFQCLPRLGADFTGVPALAKEIAAGNDVPIQWLRGLIEDARNAGEIHTDLDSTLIARVVFAALVGINELSQRESGGKDYIRRDAEVLTVLESLLHVSKGKAAKGSGTRKHKRR